MDGSQLRDRVTLQNPPDPDTIDGYGQPSGNWANVATVWADIEALTGTELFEARQVTAEVTHRVTMRWMSGVHAKQRLKTEDGRFLYLEGGIDPDNIRRELVCLCIERSPA